MTEQFRYVKAIPNPKNGELRHYFRYKGQYARLRGEPGSKEYLIHYTELLVQANSKPETPPSASKVIEFKPKPRYSGSQLDEMIATSDERPMRIAHAISSVGWAIERYIASREFMSKADGTRKNYRILLDELKGSKLGGAKIADVRTKHVTLYCREVQEKRGASRGKAMLAVISNVWQFSLGLREAGMPDEPHNPTTYAQIKYKIRSQRKAWPAEIRERFLDDAPDHLRLMFGLLLYTGQRRVDVQKMKWSDYNPKAKCISVFQKKTGEFVPVPVHKQLAKILAETPRAGAYILTSAWSKHYQGESSISHAIRNRLLEVGVPDGLYSCHGLRTTAGHMLAEAGATEVEIMRILGHKKPDQSHAYIREANKAKIGRTGMAKWEAADETAA